MPYSTTAPAALGRVSPLNGRLVELLDAISLGSRTYSFGIYWRSDRHCHLVQPHLAPVHHLGHLLYATHNMVLPFQKNFYWPRYYFMTWLEWGGTDSLRVVGLGVSCSCSVIVSSFYSPSDLLIQNHQNQG